jgi:methyl-accepting chemotaxis protein
MTQQNAAMVEQSSAAARNLADEAAELAAAVTQFQLPEGSPPPVKLATTRPAFRARAVTPIVGNTAFQAQDWAEF